MPAGTRNALAALAVLLAAAGPAVAPVSAIAASPRVRTAGIAADPVPFPVDPASRRVNLSLVPVSRLNLSKMRTGGVADASALRAVGPRSPVIETGFDGVSDGASGPITSPADPTGALGVDHVFAATNVDAAVYDRSGAELVSPQRLKSIAGLGSAYDDTDPKIVFDPSDGGWFVLTFIAYTNTQVKIVIVTSPESTIDTPGTWCSLILNGDQVAGDGAQFSDYPTIGFSGDRVAVATNNFNWAGTAFDYTQVISVRKSQLYDPTCSSPVALKVFAGNQTDNPDGSKGFTLQPVVPVGSGASSPTQFFTSFQKDRGRGRVILWRLRDSAGGLKLTNAEIGVGKVGYAPWGLQAGGSATQSNTWWDTGDLRLINAVFDTDTGRIYSANSVRHNFAPSGYLESAVRWYEIDPAATLANSTVTRKGFVGESGSDAAWPSVATDSEGVLYVTFAQASLNNGQYLSMRAATIPVGSSAATPILVKAGEARYEFSSGPERWGDYTAITRDPVDGTKMAAFGAYSIDDNSSGGPCFAAATTCRWQQWIQFLSDTP